MQHVSRAWLHLQTTALHAPRCVRAYSGAVAARRAERALFCLFANDNEKDNENERTRTRRRKTPTKDLLLHLKTNAFYSPPNPSATLMPQLYSTTIITTKREGQSNGMKSSESVVEFLKAATGKPWSSVLSKLDSFVPQINVGTKTNGLSTTLPPPSFPAITPTISCRTTQQNANGVTRHSVKRQLLIQSDDLYPEWDEFYLINCDICGMILRPQALKKHLREKHQMPPPPPPPVQHDNHAQNIVATAPTPIGSNLPIKQEQQQQLSQLPPQLPPLDSDLKQFQLSQQPEQSPPQPPAFISSRFQDRKWRNTFYVLRDAFF